MTKQSYLKEIDSPPFRSFAAVIAGGKDSANDNILLNGKIGSVDEEFSISEILIPPLASGA